MPAQPNATCMVCKHPTLAPVDPTTKKVEVRFPGPKGEYTCGRICQERVVKKKRGP